MKIGLVDVDSRHFPNLALMRLSAWHKAQGDAVEWWNGFTHYDRVYLSKVFTFTPNHDTVIDADEIVTGGTGYKDYGTLPPEVEEMFPDYSLYPQYHQAVGFLTRGCVRSCEWCIVPRKEGLIRPAATWEQVKRPDSRELVLMDNNVLACSHGLEQIERMGREEVWVDFNQGLDARLITPDIARSAGEAEMDSVCAPVLRHQRHGAGDRAGRGLSAGSRHFVLPALVLCAGPGCGGSTSEGTGSGRNGN